MKKYHKPNISSLEERSAFPAAVAAIGGAKVAAAAASGLAIGVAAGLAKKVDFDMKRARNLKTLTAEI